MESFAGRLYYSKSHGENRPSLLNLSPDLFPDGGPKADSLIEITGSTDSCGKTQLLLEIIAKTILPASLGGKCGSVIFYNQDHQFNKCFFERILRKYSSEDSVIEECWERLEIINIFIPEELQVHLKTLDQKILINNQSITLVVLDSLATFYYLEDDENANMYHHYKKMVEQLRNIVRHHHVTFAYSLPYFYNPKHDGSLTMSNYRFHLVPGEDESGKMVKIVMSTCGSIYKKVARLSKQGLIIDKKKQ